VGRTQAKTSSKALPPSLNRTNHNPSVHRQIKQDPTKEPTWEMHPPTQGSKAQPFYTFEFDNMI
jgi:hypothetical protein